ncbi:hypothetical protein AAFJ72_09995 [Brevibacillus gelatini]|uniref:Uncharacterized protein n=1 Tax=Brevibacillus gelatini TaxID=1655277 RepID=A0A3M8B5P2_9BACL|nr:hypothetical protein [Brevibacillus gelatini]RNB58640.1 hypothetical protein EDM57_07925 [Brevibacillus gelatini]
MLSSKVNGRKWRNPYAPIPSKKLSDQATDVSLAISPRKIIPAVDLRSSVSKMRSNIKGISSTIRQVEETMDTLYGAMEIIENLGKRSAEPEASAEKPASGRRKGNTGAAKDSAKGKDTARAEEAPQESSAAAGGGGSNPLGNIDIGQLLGLLQSPLVQNLLTQTVSGTSKQRKKEG